jgi:hypothetical protein
LEPKKLFRLVGRTSAYAIAAIDITLVLGRPGTPKSLASLIRHMKASGFTRLSEAVEPVFADIATERNHSDGAE